MKTLQTIVIMSAILSLAGGLGMQSAFAGTGTSTPLGASVTIAGNCEVVIDGTTPSLAFGSVDPVANSLANGGASATGTGQQQQEGFLLILNNGGNQDAEIVVDGDNWDAAGPVEIMSAGQTKFSDDSGNIGSKTALPNAEDSATPLPLTVITPGTPDFGEENTYWDLDVTLDIDPTFTSGALSQVITLDFACT